MASPTAAEIRTEIGHAINLLEEFRKYVHVNGENFLAHEDALVQALETDFAPEILSAAAGIRSSLGAAMRQGRALVAPFLRDYAKVLDVPAEDLDGILGEIYDAMHDASEAVTSRQFSFGTPSAGGGNAGNGELLRVTLDAKGYDIEAATAEEKLFRCVEDENSGASEHREVFLVEGDARERDGLKLTGSGIQERLQVAAAEDSLLRNPSWSDKTTSGGSLASFPGWTVSAIGSFEHVSADFYKRYRGETTPYSIRMTANATIEQNLNVQRKNLNPRVPMLLQVAFKRENSCDGTLTLTLGSQTESVVLSAQAGWNVLRIDPASTKVWFENWNQEDPLVKVALTGRTTGQLLLDDVIFVPFRRIDGTWWNLVGGSTPFLYDDQFTVTDTEVGAILQYWFWRLFGRYLPHGTAGAVTWSEP